MDFPNTLEFVNNTGKRLEWISERFVIEEETWRIECYMRHSRRRIDGQRLDCVDVANVMTTPQRKGTFTAFMTMLEGLPINIFVENVLSKSLSQWFTKRDGYRAIYATGDEDKWPPSFVRIVGETKDGQNCF